MDIKHIIGHITQGSARLLAVMAVTAFIVVSCQDSDQIESTSVWLTPSFVALNNSSKVQTRVTVGDGDGNYKALTKDGISVQAFAIYKSGSADNGDVNATFTYSESQSKWNGKIRLMASNVYDAYAYSGAGSAQMLNNTTMKITGIPIVTETDPIVSNASCAKENEADYSGYLTPGSFTTDQIGTPGPGHDWKISFAMEHLYAGVRFNFQVAHSDKVERTFVLKEAKLIYPSKSTVDATVTFGAGGITNVVFDNKQGTGCQANIFSGEKVLNESPQPIEASFLPNDVDKVQLKCTYDVKDRKGDVVRGGCTATNNIKFSKDPNAQGGDYSVRGTQRTYNLTINPTYLYQMSDGDIDSPAFTVSTE